MSVFWCQSTFISGKKCDVFFCFVGAVCVHIQADRCNRLQASTVRSIHRPRAFGDVVPVSSSCSVSTNTTCMCCWASPPLVAYPSPIQHDWMNSSIILFIYIYIYVISYNVYIRIYIYTIIYIYVYKSISYPLMSYICHMTLIKWRKISPTGDPKRCDLP